MDNKLRKLLSERELASIGNKFFERFYLLYKLRSESVDYIAANIPRYIKSKPKNVSLRFKPVRPKNYHSQIYISLINTRNILVDNYTEYSDKFDCNSMIEFFDRNLRIIDKIDKQLDSLKITLEDYKQDFEIQTKTISSSANIGHTLTLVLKGSESTSKLRESIINSKSISKLENNFLEATLDQKEIGDLIFNAVASGRRTKKIRKVEGKVLNTLAGNFAKAKKDRDKALQKAESISGSVIATANKPKSTYSEKDLPEFLSVVQILNTKLRAAVISNMGTPSLVNRTGRFASSASVVGMAKVKSSLIIDYAYQQRPYMIFERELGTNPWNLEPERDPRKIIEKSLRQLAVEMKLDQLGLNIEVRRNFE